MRAIDGILVGERVMGEKESNAELWQMKEKNIIESQGKEVGPLRDGRRKPGHHIGTRKHRGRGAILIV